MCFTLEGYTTGWQQLECGIAMGCVISPILFVLARQVVRGIKLPSGERLPPLRSYLDDVTSILQTAPGILYTADLSDRQMGKLARQQLAEGLARIELSHLPGKLKVWCYQQTLFQRVLWPLKVCEIPITEVIRMDSHAKNNIRKWFSLPANFQM